MSLGPARKSRRGFSLVESLIAVLVMGVTAAALFSTLGSMKVLQTESRQVNAMNRVATEFIENLRDKSYLTLKDAFPSGEYTLNDFRYFRGENGQTVTIIDPYIISDLRATCQEYRVAETIRVTPVGDILQFSVQFRRLDGDRDTVVQMVTDISKNGINFK